MGNLTYKINGERVYFYYGEKLIFRNSKSIPFVLSKKKTNGVETAVSFDRFSIEDTEKGFSVWFWNENKEEKKIKLDLKENREEKTVLFTFDYKEEEDLCLTLYVGRHDTVLGLPVCKGIFAKKKRGLFRRRKKEKIYADRKLSYRIPDRYFFENKNVTDYSIEIKDAVYLTIQSKDPSFLLRFSDKKEREILQTETNIKKYPENSLFIKTKEVSTKKIKDWINKYDYLQGIVIEARPFDVYKIQREVELVHKMGLDILYCVNGKVGEYHKKRYFRQEKMFAFQDEYYPDLQKENNVRAYLVIVRKYLDESADGIYFDGFFSKSAITGLQEGMTTVCKEYPKVSVFHSTVSERNEDFGYLILKNKTLIDHFDKLSVYYENSGEKQIGKEENKYTENSHFSISILKK